MTCLEKLIKDHPDLLVGDIYDKYMRIVICPHEYLERPEWCPGVCGSKECRVCWNRKIPERGTKPEEPTMPAVLYRCDRRACKTCSFPDCQHTPDISHAVDFHKNENGTYVED